MKAKVISLALALVLVLALSSPALASGGKHHGEVGQGSVWMRGNCPHYGDW